MELENKKPETSNIENKIVSEQYCEIEETIIKIPDNITVIEKWAFLDCYSLKDVIYSDNITRIDEEAFCNCCYLNDILIPKNLETFDHCICYNCSNLTNIIWNADVRPTKDLVNTMFVNCKNLHTIKYKNEVINVPLLLEYAAEIELTEEQVKKYKNIIMKTKILNSLMQFKVSVISLIISLIVIYFDIDIIITGCVVSFFLLSLGITIITPIYSIIKLNQKNNFYIVYPKIYIPYLEDPYSKEKCEFSYHSPSSKMRKVINPSNDTVEELNGNYNMICDSSNIGFAFIEKDFKELSEKQ